MNIYNHTAEDQPSHGLVNRLIGLIVVLITLSIMATVIYFASDHIDQLQRQDYIESEHSEIP